MTHLWGNFPRASNLLSFPHRTLQHPRRHLCSKVNGSLSILDLSRVLFLRYRLVTRNASLLTKGIRALLSSYPWKLANPFLPVDPTVGFSQIASCLATTLMLRDFEMLYVGNWHTTNTLYQHHRSNFTFAIFHESPQKESRGFAASEYIQWNFAQ